MFEPLFEVVLMRCLTEGRPFGADRTDFLFSNIFYDWQLTGFINLFCLRLYSVNLGVPLCPLMFFCLNYTVIDLEI